MASTRLLKLEGDATIVDASKRLGMPRREFLQFCATVAAGLGLPPGAEAAVAEAMAAKKRPSVIWLHFQECTGCTESLLRSELALPSGASAELAGRITSGDSDCPTKMLAAALRLSTLLIPVIFSSPPPIQRTTSGITPTW